MGGNSVTVAVSFDGSSKRGRKERLHEQPDNNAVPSHLLGRAALQADALPD